MQAGQNIDKNPRSRVSTIMITALTLFAIAGLMSGFIFGTVTHKSPVAIKPKPQITAPTIAAKTETPSPTVAPKVVVLGFPKFTSVPPTNEKPDGQATYTTTVQAMDKQGHSVTQSGITCKIWLVQRIPDGASLQLPGKKDLTTIQAPIPGQVNGQPVNEVGGLTFDPTTPQLQPCNSQGQGTWKYTIATTVPPGKYDIVVLADWKGVHYNWSWAHIVIGNA